MMRRNPQRLTVCKIRQLDDDTVQRIRQGFYFSYQPRPAVFQLTEFNTVGNHIIIHQGQKRFIMLYLILYSGNILEPHDTGDGVTGIFVKLAVFTTDIGKFIIEHIIPDDYFTTHRTIHWSPVASGLKFYQRQLRADVLPLNAIATGSEDTINIISGNAVVLGLNLEHLRIPPGMFGRPFQQLLKRIDLGERQHGTAVPHFPVRRHHRSMYLPDKRMLRINQFQSTHKMIIIIVADLRLPLFPIATIMIFYKSDQLRFIQSVWIIRKTVYSHIFSVFLQYSLVMALQSVNYTLTFTAQFNVKIKEIKYMTSASKDLIMRAAQVTPSIRQLKWQEMELTAFIHFTVNTFTDKEWGDGSESPSIFNPVQCDPRQWIKNLKDAGFKMTILTTKHHDGFCLWPSKYTEHSIKNSPYKNGNGDIVREFCDACREFDMKIGLYLSPWDRHEESYGDSPRYNEYFKNQLRELCAYGEIACFWFDGACAEGPNGKRQEYDWDGYYALIRELQPGAIIDDVGPDARWCGNEAGKGREAEWSVVNMNKSFVQFNSENCTLDTIGSLEQLGEGENLYWYPSEVDTSIRPGWFYHASEDKKVKSLKKLVQIYINSVGGNAVLLLNFPPDKRGLLHENDVARLKEFREYLNKAFEVNYAGNAKIKASAEKPGFEAEKILDDNPESYWTVADWMETAELELNIDKTVTINTVMLQEQIRAGQRIENFAIDCRVDSQWREVAAGKTVGYKKLICFDPVRTDAVRIRITGSRLCPTLSNCAIYNLSLIHI
eukprot:TRINITY_DN6916_c0_g1_i2.p1 TRINITY_DN6916_c0_g1~~TRINITY_DN6916_c0_g1_i2.p1  ORF type:complete len:774 (+),score=147.06 TRINITY_DN6916_c0_g1_i2:1219-3540(+)